MTRRRNVVSYEFVDYIPKELEEGVVYIAPEFGTVIHLCCDGCGEKVSTPLHPAQWKLTFDGESISLSPSVGNWDLPCGSHYWIVNNKVRWAGTWTKHEIETGRKRDQHDVELHYSNENPEATKNHVRTKMSFWHRLWHRH